MSFKLEISGSTLGLQSWKSLLAVAELHWMVSFRLEWFDVQHDVAERRESEYVPVGDNCDA